MGQKDPTLDDLDACREPVELFPTFSLLIGGFRPEAHNGIHAVVCRGYARALLTVESLGEGRLTGALVWAS